ncbi:hypothetical protein B0J12DRAFT_22165 [Macrophomina phaseolina]|uniref:Uncharacterized protein n=1 Tax=Macrophomina phaseolina TaxID=35725 RepID=A0ABQ8GUR4_9PEZI|nr:hypothetical protein B0J12DRAFT_22165 [Macrophomina phaseolina]
MCDEERKGGTDRRAGAMKVIGDYAERGCAGRAWMPPRSRCDRRRTMMGEPVVESSSRTSTSCQVRRSQATIAEVPSARSLSQGWLGWRTSLRRSPHKPFSQPGILHDASSFALLAIPSLPPSLPHLTFSVHAIGAATKLMVAAVAATAPRRPQNASHAALKRIEGSEDVRASASFFFFGSPSTAVSSGPYPLATEARHAPGHLGRLSGKKSRR